MCGRDRAIESRQDPQTEPPISDLMGRRFSISTSWFVLSMFIISMVCALPRDLRAQEPSATQIASVESIGRVHQGDLIDVHVRNFVEYDWRGNLDAEGFLKGFDKITNAVYARCKTVDQVADDIQKSLASVLRNPIVDVRIIDTSRRAFATVDGAVKTPQRFQFRRLVRLQEIIVNSGGITDRASGDIQISRPPGLSCFETKGEITRTFTVRIADLLAGDENADPWIVSGDLVVISEALPVYLLGAVATQGKLDFRPDLTVSRAIDSAGGITKDGSPTRISIFRREGGSSTLAVDLEKIRSKSTDDVKLRPYDIIDIPFKGRPPKRLPPVIEDFENERDRRSKLPLKIIE